MEMINPFLEQGEMVLETETHEIFSDPHTDALLATPYNGAFHGVSLPEYVAVIQRDKYSGEYKRIIMARATSIPAYAAVSGVDLIQFIMWLKATAYERQTGFSPLKTYKQILEENELATESKESDTRSDAEPGHTGAGDGA